MPIYFKEFENIIEKWVTILKMKKPTDDRASWYSYKSMQKAAKKTFLKELLEIFSEVDINSIIISEDNDTEKEYTIRILSKL